MKKIHIKKPDLKGGLQKLKNLKKEDIVAHWKASRERRARILEARRNSAFAKKMQPVYEMCIRDRNKSEYVTIAPTSFLFVRRLA